jgi:hypothetical protein
MSLITSVFISILQGQIRQTGNVRACFEGVATPR